MVSIKKIFIYNYIEHFRTSTPDPDTMLLDSNNNMNRHMSPVPPNRQPSAEHLHRKELLERQLSKERNLSSERAHAIERSQDRYVGGSGGGERTVSTGTGQPAQIYKEREMVEVRRLPDEETYLRYEYFCCVDN